MTVPTPSINLLDLINKILDEITKPGVLTVDPACDSVIYLPEHGNKWTWPPGGSLEGSEVTADFVATPRGIIKFGNGCHCDVSCSGGDRYAVVCDCRTQLIVESKAVVKKREADKKEFPKFKDDAWWVETEPPLYQDGNVAHPNPTTTLYRF